MFNSTHLSSAIFRFPVFSTAVRQRSATQRVAVGDSLNCRGKFRTERVGQSLAIGIKAEVLSVFMLE